MYTDNPEQDYQDFLRRQEAIQEEEIEEQEETVSIDRIRAYVDYQKRLRGIDEPTRCLWFYTFRDNFIRSISSI